MQHKTGLADALEITRRPLVGYLLERVGSRLLDHTVEVTKRGFARGRTDRQRIAIQRM